MKQLLGITVVIGLLASLHAIILPPNGYALDNPSVGAQYQTYPSTGTDEPPGKWKCECAGGMPVWTLVPGMADYHLNPFQGTLQVADMPLTYQAAFGPSTQVRFHYDSGDTSENGVAGGTVSGLQHSNLGPKWKLNWVQFIEDQPAQPATVALNMGRGGASALTLQPNGTYARPGISNDVLEVQGASSYLHRLSDGTSEVYATVAGPGTGGIRRLFLTSVSDRAGNTLQLAWQAEGGGTRLSTLTDAAGKVTTFAYDAANPLRLTKVTDPFGRFCTLQYRATGELWKITDPVEIVSEFGYEPGGGAVVSSLTTPYGVTSFSTGVLLTPAGQPNGTYTVATDPVGHSERIERAAVTVAADLPANEPVPAGFNTARLNLQNTFYWSKQALASGASVANARIIRWAEDFSGAPVSVPVSVKAPLVNRQWFTYAGQADIWHSGTGAGPASVVQVLPDASVQTTQATYTAKGRVETATDAQGRQTLYDYLANGDDLWKVRHIAGAQTDVLAVFENYDNQGHPWTVTGADGTQTQLTFNGHGQALSVTNALGEQTTFAYQENAASPAFGRRTTETAAVGTALVAATSFFYDDYARVHTITNHDNDVVTLDYDAIGGAPLKSLDRVTTTTGPDGSGAWVLWDRLDVGERHEFYPGVAERVTTYTHNDNRELTDVLLPSGKTLSYVPGNCCGTMDTLVDAAGNQTHWEHDVLGRETDKWLRWGQAEQVKVEHLEYDAAGRLGTAQDARGNVKTYGYDAGSRLHTIQYTLPAQTTTQPTPDVTFDYDPAYARLQRVLDGTGTTTYGYVPMNLSDTVYGDGAVGTERKVLPDGTTQIYSFSRAFDALGRVNSGPRQTFAQWDALGRPLDTVSGLGSFGFGFEGKSGRLAQVDATLTGASAVMRTGLAYQGAGTLRRLTGITHQTGADTNSLGALSHHDYGYDGLGRLGSWQKWIGAVQASAWTTILYDEDDQLKEVDDTASPAVAFGYGYDNAGNRTAASRVPAAGGGVSRTWSANGLNQLTAQTAGPESGAQFAYDDDGNVLGDGTRIYEWDAENRLVAVNYGTASRVEWSYDAFHRRVKQTDTTAAGVVVHDLVWDGLTLIENRASQSGTPGEVRRYYGNGEERLPAGGGVTRLYYTTDHLGSIRELADATGAVRARYDYDPYGARTKLVGDLDCDFGFTGHYTHAASGLVLAPYRGYDPGTGRWLSRDPIGEEGGINLYGYVFNNPVELIDPLGLDALYLNRSGSSWHGHAAVLVGNPEAGYTYYSKNGYSNPNDIKLFPTEDAFKKWNDKQRKSVCYDRQKQFKTTPEQDKAMKDYANKNLNTPFDKFDNNCMNFVDGVFSAGGIQLPRAMTPNQVFLLFGDPTLRFHFINPDWGNVDADGFALPL